MIESSPSTVAYLCSRILLEGLSRRARQSNDETGKTDPLQDQ